MRVLFATQYGLGHLFVLSPLAEALAAKRHDIVFVCRPSFVPAIQARGFSVFPVGPDDGSVEKDISQAFQLATRLPTFEAQSTAIRASIHAGITASAALHDMHHKVIDIHPDVIIRDTLEFSSWAVAESLNIPHASVEIGAFWDAARWEHAAAAQLRRLFAFLAHPVIPPIHSLYRFLHLSFLPPIFRDPHQQYPPTAWALQPGFSQRSHAEAVPPWLMKLPEKPVVYVTLGTSQFNQTPGVFESILEALAPEDLTLILTIGKNQEPHQFGAQPPNVKIAQFIPQHTSAFL